MRPFEVEHLGPQRHFEKNVRAFDPAAPWYRQTCTCRLSRNVICSRRHGVNWEKYVTGSFSVCAPRIPQQQWNALEDQMWIPVLAPSADCSRGPRLHRKRTNPLLLRSPRRESVSPFLKTCCGSPAKPERCHFGRLATPEPHPSPNPGGRWRHFERLFAVRCRPSILPIARGSIERPRSPAMVDKAKRHGGEEVINNCIVRPIETSGRPQRQHGGCMQRRIH